MELVMAAMAIIWRNPKPVRHHLRWSQQAQIGGRTVYKVEQLVSPQRDVWVNASVLELIRKTEQVPTSQPEPGRWRLSFGL
jgi:hypothetical protein